jgi:hypothetical protein
MKIPKQFQYLATCFYQGSDREHATVEEWITSTVRNFLSVEERKVVKQFLDELLSGSHTDEDLQRLWENLDSDYWIESGAGVRAFLTVIRDKSA